MSESYTNLHSHTDYSNAALGFSDCINRVPELIQRAYDIGLSGIAITDHECISGFVKALKYYEKMERDRDFNLILGNEIYLLTDEEHEANINGSTKTPQYHFILNALDTEGYHQLCELSTRAWKRAYVDSIWRRPTLYSDLEEIIKPNQGHIVASSACLGSRIDKLLLNGKDNEALNEVKHFQDIFGKDNFFLEIQPSKDSNCDQSKVNKKMLWLSQISEVPLIATTDAHYLKKEDKLIHKIFLNSQDGEREVDDFYATAYLMDAEELREYLHHEFTDEQIDEMFRNTETIRQRVKGYDIWHDPIIPQIPTDKIPTFEIKHYFKEWYDKYPIFKYYATLGQDHLIQERYFFYQCEQGLYEKVYTNPKKQNKIEDYIARLDTEWNELYKISEALHTSLVCYYSTMTKIIDIMWDAGSIVGCGRGSSAGFLTCYVLGISQCDPVPLGDYLPYWRHMALERGEEVSDIDTDSEPSKKYAIIQGVKDFFGEDRVLNVATFGTVSAKTAIERACRGLGLSDDVSGYIKSLIPVNRGKITPLKECLYGSEKNGTKPITEIVNEINKYPNLKECALGICDLICQRGLHSAGLVIGNEPYTNHLAAMRAPNKTLCTCYDLWDSEAVSEIKFDLLTLDAVQKIHYAMDAMLKDGVIQWQGSLRTTYDKYLHPDVIDYTTPEMWESTTKMYSLFQWVTAIGIKALAQVKPKNIMDLSAANSLIRLMPDNAKETPLETYVRYDKDETEWERDTTNYGLNQDEKDIIAHYCKDAHYLADCQEKIMRISMDKHVAGYTLKEANLLRKAIARKDAKLQEQAKKQFFEYGKKIGTREIFLKYIWEELFSASLGYSFSSIHSYVYSVIALQELNLFYHYNPVYWNVGCLSSEATPDDEGSGGNTDYGKLAKAIYNMAKFGVMVNAPDINKSDNDFTPIAKENRIVFGLAAISGINSDISAQIIANRPYTSFADFYTRNTYPGSLVTASKIKQLIKAGCFDCFNPNRISVMKEYICLSTPLITSVNGQNLPAILSSKVSIPRNLSAPYRWLKYVCSKQFLYGNHPQYKSKKLYWLDDRALKYFNDNLVSSLTESVDCWQEDDRTIVVDKSLEKLLKPSIDALMQYINTPEFLDSYNNTRRKQAYDDFIDGVENVNLWSFDSCSFFSHDHVLAHVDYKTYNLSNYKELPEEPRFVERSFRGRTWRQYELSAICGIVLSRTDAHHVVTILTPENEVVNVKFNQGTFAWYKQQFSEVDDKGKKTVLDKSWFNRGTMIIVSGYRRGDEFVAKKYKNSIYQHQVALIESIDENNNLTIRSERYGRDEESTNEY